MTSEPINIFSDLVEETPALDFNIQTPDGRTVEVTLPVIGEKNVPLGVIAAVGAWRDATTGSVEDQAAVLYQLLESVRGAWPEQGRILWSLDAQSATKLFEAWFEASEASGFDPKA